MSDFDEEAERERLREKYDSEAEDRKRTQQMSELLLKGATMTNAHCGECGSPIFRHEDEEFCPSCQRAIDGSAADGEAEDGTQAAGEAPDAADPGDAGGVDVDVTGSMGDAKGVDPDATAGADPAAAGTGTPDANGIDRRTSATAGAHGETAEPTEGRGRGVAGSDAAGKAAPGSQTAHKALYAALTRHARLAAETDDPRRATEHLSAAREAAAAVDELDG